MKDLWCATRCRQENKRFYVVYQSWRAIFQNSSKRKEEEKRRREKKKRKFNDRTEIIVVTWISSLYLNSSKKRKLIQNVKIDVTFIEKSCTASLMILFQTRKWSYEAMTITCAIIYLTSVSNLVKKISCLTFRSEEDQNMKALISTTRWDHDEIFIKSATDLNLHASSVLYVVSIWAAFSWIQFYYFLMSLLFQTSLFMSSRKITRAKKSTHFYLRKSTRRLMKTA
jgi:hypothetical protein